jgi:hypothetical protein
MFEFKQIHGFREFFKSHRLACPEHGQMDIEIDLGHVLPYYKPTFEHRLEQYVRSLQALVIEEATEIKLQSEEEISKMEQKYDNLSRKITEEEEKSGNQ